MVKSTLQLDNRIPHLVMRSSMVQVMSATPRKEPLVITPLGQHHCDKGDSLRSFCA